MDTVRHLMRAVRVVIACCGALVVLGAYTIAFAEKPAQTPRVADITNSNIALGR
jgi:hypothetical protein